MKIALIILAVLILLLFLPTHFVIQYVDNDFNIYIRLWYVIKIRLLKKKDEKSKKESDESSKDTENTKTDALSPSEKMEKISVVLRLIVNTLKLFCRHFKMYRCHTNILVAGEDPANVAIEFGLVNAAVYGIISYLNEKIKIGRKEIYIGYDYQQEQTTFEVDFRFKVIVLIFLMVLICTNFRDIMTLISKPEEIKAEV